MRRLARWLLRAGLAVVLLAALAVGALAWRGPVQVQALDAGLFPSGNARCLVVDGTLYVFSESYVQWGWLRALRRDPRARLRIAGRLYDARLTPLADPAEIEPLLAPLLRKYFAVEAVRPRLVGSTPRYPGTQVGLNFFRAEPAG